MFYVAVERDHCELRLAGPIDGCHREKKRIVMLCFFKGRSESKRSKRLDIWSALIQCDLDDIKCG